MNSKDSPFSILEKLEKQICWKIGPSPSHLKWKLENALLRSESCKPSRYGGGIVGLGVKIHTKKWGNKKQTERDVYIYITIYIGEKKYARQHFSILSLCTYMLNLTLPRESVPWAPQRCCEERFHWRACFPAQPALHWFLFWTGFCWSTNSEWDVKSEWNHFKNGESRCKGDLEDNLFLLKNQTWLVVEARSWKKILVKVDWTSTPSSVLSWKVLEATLAPNIARETR